MKYVLIIQEVDYCAKWKVGFDDGAALRKQVGELEYQLLQYEDESRKEVHF